MAPQNPVEACYSHTPAPLFSIMRHVSSGSQSPVACLQGARGVVVSHPLRMRKTLGAIPSVSMHRKIDATSHPPSHPADIASSLAKKGRQGKQTPKGVKAVRAEPTGFF